MSISMWHWPPQCSPFLPHSFLIMQFSENTATGLGGLFRGLAPRASLSQSVLSCQRTEEPCCNQQQDKNRALTLPGICFVLLSSCVFPEMSLTGDRVQGSPRPQISRLNVPQGVVETESQALVRGAISQTHCSQFML